MLSIVLVRITPSFNSGIKMEKFVFDVFQFSKSLAVLEIVREDEFAPLKNPPGVAKESPYTSRAAVYDLHYRLVYVCCCCCLYIGVKM